MNKTSYSNIPSFIEEKLSRQLHHQMNHPIEIIKDHIYDYFARLEDYHFDMFDNLSQVVSIEDNFDKLLIPLNHVTRSKSDSYYVNDKEVLRTHTSAHQNELLSKGYTSFIVVGDVYRKDECDTKHYAIFHQLEVLTLVADDKDAIFELKKLLSGLIEYLFPNCQYRFNNDYFPFTDPSYEIEVMYKGNWLEVLGCGIVHPDILKANNISGQAIAAGFGLDRLVMIFCDIPDIRYLWSTHERFLNQFADGKLNQFVPYSTLPDQIRDISFYVLNMNNQKWLDENDFYELIRNYEDVKEVKLIDTFYNKKIEQHSRTYRLTYSPNRPDKNPAEFTKYVNDIQDQLRINVQQLNITLR